MGENCPIYFPESNTEILAKFLVDNTTIIRVQLDDPVHVYSIYTQKRQPIYMQNMLVLSWCGEECNALEIMI